MIAHGSPRTVFRIAIAHENLVLAEFDARKLGAVTLAEALELTALVAVMERRRSGRCAARWYGRRDLVENDPSPRRGGTVSVIMTFRIAGDPDKLEQLAAENGDLLRAISERAKEHGLISHRFYGADGQILVLDEWPDPESFQRFFESQRGGIEPMLQRVATGEPEITFWRKLETNDDVG